MAKRFPIPKKILNPRAVHLYDLIALVVMFAVALTVLPFGTTLDLSVGFNEKSEAYLDFEREEINLRAERTTVSVSFIEKLFASTTIQNGGTVYYINDNAYWHYKDGKQGLTYYPVEFGKSEEDQPRARTSADGDLPRGLISGNWYISTGEDGRIYYDTLDGSSGWSDFYVDTSKANPEDMTAILLEDDLLSVGEAALVWVMAQERTLIGYENGVAWFAVPAEDGVHILKGTRDGIEEIDVLQGQIDHTMVADNKLLFYVQDGNVTIRNLDTREGLYFPNTTDWTELGSVRQLAYVKLKDGYIRLYSLNEVTSTYTDFSGIGTENRGTVEMGGINCQNYSEVFTTRGNTRFTLWFQDIGQIVWRHEED